MSHWNGEVIVRWEPVPYPDYPGWVKVDCGCCVGLQWGGEEPRECPHCNGGGMLALHVKSRRLALYPGGPFRGVDDAPGVPREARP